VKLRAEGETWLMIASGLDTAGVPSGERTFTLATAMTEPVRSYFIVFDPAVDGSFTHDAEGNAEIHLVVRQPDGVSEDYFSGICTDATP
jgi:hypothetical protein